MAATARLFGRYFVPGWVESFRESHVPWVAPIVDTFHMWGFLVLNILVTIAMQVYLTSNIPQQSVLVTSLAAIVSGAYR